MSEKKIKETKIELKKDISELNSLLKQITILKLEDRKNNKISKLKQEISKINFTINNKIKNKIN